MYVDEMLTCVDCGRQFVFTAGEQRFYEQKGFQNKPNRCPDCRQARKAMRAQGQGSTAGARPREMFAATCSNCGNVAEVPFNPRGDKPIYCRECFSSRNNHSQL